MKYLDSQPILLHPGPHELDAQGAARVLIRELGLGGCGGSAGHVTLSQGDPERDDPLGRPGSD